MTEQALRRQILDLVARYAVETTATTPFVAGQTGIEHDTNRVSAPS